MQICMVNERLFLRLLFREVTLRFEPISGERISNGTRSIQQSDRELLLFSLLFNSRPPLIHPGTSLGTSIPRHLPTRVLLRPSQELFLNNLRTRLMRLATFSYSMSSQDWPDSWMVLSQHSPRSFL